MSRRDPVEYWSEWLIDAVAGATQDRRYLRGEPECDENACEAIIANGAHAIRMAIKEAATKGEDHE